MNYYNNANILIFYVINNHPNQDVKLYKKSQKRVLIINAKL